MTTTFWVRRPRRKVMMQAIASCIRQNLSNSFQTSTWHLKEYNGREGRGGVYRVYTLSNSVHALKQLEMTTRSEPELRFKTPRRGIIKNQKKSIPRETEKHSFIHTADDWWKANLWTKSWWRDQKEPGLKSESILSRWSWSDEFFVLIFFNGRVVPTGVRTHVVATTVCATGSVHTHSLVARTFFLVHNFVHAHFSCMWTHHALLKLFAVRMSSLLTHIFLSCFTRLCSCCSLTVTSRPLPATTLLTPTTPAELSRPESTGQAHSARGRAVWLPGQVHSSHRSWAQGVRQDHFRGQWHDDRQRSGPQFFDFSKTTNENTRQFGVFHSVWILCFARFSFVILFFREKAKKACNRETVARQRERGKRRFCDQCWRVDVNEKSMEQY